MGKKRQDGGGNPIARRLVAKMERPVRGKVVNIKNVIAGQAAAEELQKTVVTNEGLAGFHPAHAAYVYAQKPGVGDVGATHRPGRDGALRGHRLEG
jgi:hypothetical protein